MASTTIMFIPCAGGRDALNAPLPSTATDTPFRHAHDRAGSARDLTDHPNIPRRVEGRASRRREHHDFRETLALNQRREHTLPRRHITRIGRAVVDVVAELRLPHARAIRAGVGEGARLTIRAGRRVPDLNAARGRVTGIIRADVSVVAVRRRPALTALLVACVERGAGIAVITGLDVRQKHAPFPRVTDIVRAAVAVVTREKIRTWSADRGHAHVVERACVAVLAGRLVGQMDAPEGGVAVRVGTRIPVLAARHEGPRAPLAPAVRADIPD